MLELNAATNLDKKGDVKSSPLYGRTVAEIDMMKMTPTLSASNSHLPDKKNFIEIVADIFLVLLIVLVFCTLIYYLIDKVRRNDATPIYVPAYRDHTHVASAPMRTDDGFPTTHLTTPVYQTSYPVQSPPPMQSSSGGMGMMGTAASVAGGVVAGELIHDALTRRQTHRLWDDDEDDSRRRRNRDNDSAPSSYVPDLLESHLR